MLRYVKWVGLVSLCALTSCSYIQNSGLIQNRDTDFLKAKSIPPLRIPPGLSSSTIEAHYPVSDIAHPAVTKPVDLTPPGLYTPITETTTTTTSPKKQRAESLEMSAREEAELEAAVGNIVPKDELAQAAKPIAHIPTQTTALPIAQEPVAAKQAPETLAATSKPHYNAPLSTTQKVSAALKSVWPWKNKANATETTSVAQTSKLTSVATKTTEMLGKLRSAWPWGSKKPAQAV